MDELKRQLLGLLEDEAPIGLISHINPDGDGFCACLFLAKWLALQGKDSVIITDGEIWRGSRIFWVTLRYSAITTR